MATTFYFTEDQAAPVSPLAPVGSTTWEHIAPSIPTRALQLSPDTSTLTTTAYTPDAADDITDKDACHRQYVSPPLAAQTVSGNVTAQFQGLEAHANNNLFITLKLMVISNDGSTLRQIILAITRSTGNEYTTTLRNATFPSTAMTSYACAAGDRILVEVGLGGSSTATGGVQGHNGSLRFGGNASSGDLPVDNTQTGTTYRPWISFSTDPLFNVVIQATDTCAVLASDAIAGTRAIAAQDTAAIVIVEPDILQSSFVIPETVAIQASDATPTITPTGDGGTVNKNVTDSCTIQASDEVIGTRAIVAVETLVLQLTDEIQGTRLILSLDSCAIQASDVANPPAAVVPVSDIAQIQASDSASIPFLTTQASDILQMIAVDTVPGPHVATAIDTVAVQASEQTTNVLLTLAADSCAIQAAESTPSVAAIIQAADTVAVQASEAAPTLTAVLSITDTCAIVAVDTVAGPHLATAADSLAIQASESIQQLTAAVSAVDSAAIQASDTALVIVSVSAQDTLPIILSDPPATVILSTLFTISATDTCAVQASEAAAILSPILVRADDVATLQASEAVAGPHLATAQDDLRVQVSEQTGLSVTLTAIDSCAIQVNDATPSIAASGGSTTVPATDVCAMQLADATPSILVTISVSDSLAVVLAESVSPGPQLLTVNDAVLLGMQDVFTPGPLALMVQDSLGISLTEQARIAATFTIQDTLRIQASESVSVFTDVPVTILATDLCAVGCTDTMTADITDRSIPIWGGGSETDYTRLQPDPTSYRIPEKKVW